MNKQEWTIRIIILTCVVMHLTGCGSPQALVIKKDLAIQPELFVDLGPTCTVLDGMAMDTKGDIYLAVPNFIDYETYPSKIVKIDKNRNVTDWCTDLPRHIDTDQVHPMGMEFGPDGNLYVADNQYFSDKNCKSRLLRVIVKDGKPVRCDVVIEGFKLANAVRWKGNNVYVSDTFFDLPNKKHQSGIYRISLNEINSGLVSLLPPAKDPHLIIQFTAKDFGTNEETAGADGVCFDSKSNLYCGNFGDGVISKISFDENQNVVDQQVIIDHPSIECCDGICCDLKTDKIYITNSKNNSVHIYDTTAHTLQYLWVNEDNNGATGLLDQPCEPLLRNGQLIVVNFDMPFPGLKNSENDAYHTLSVFGLSN